MPVLIVHQGTDDLYLSPANEKTYVYRIGAGRVVGRKCEDLNDSLQLNQISSRLRDKYVSWVYEFNNEFLKQGLVWEGASLFFLSDLSNKRNELFDTFNTLTVLTLLKTVVESKAIDSVLLYGLDESFVRAARSAFPEKTVDVKNRVSRTVSLVRRVLADIKFALFLTVVVGLNKVFSDHTKNVSDKKARYFFSFFPQTFDGANKDIRYGADVQEEDKYLVAMMADGMHQQLGPIAYWKYRKKVEDRKFAVIDQGARISDLLLGGRIWWKAYRFLKSRNQASDMIFGIDLSGYIYEELVWSISRISRLVVFSKSLERVVSRLQISELIYLVFEFPLGRAISSVLGRKFPDIKRVGFNHGEYSWRFVNYFLDRREPSVAPPYLVHCPIPDRVLAEDDLTAQIYKYNGYQDVQVMKVVRRLSYLEKVQRGGDPLRVLIVAGLHDGDNLLQVMLPKVKSDSSRTYIFRPHPRARNNYLTDAGGVPNLIVDQSPIHEVLSTVGHVFVTYSGLGFEVASIGIPITVVNIPGRVNWSKCIDVVEGGYEVGARTPLIVDFFSP